MHSRIQDKLPGMDHAQAQQWYRHLKKQETEETREPEKEADIPTQREIRTAPAAAAPRRHYKEDIDSDLGERV